MFATFRTRTRTRKTRRPMALRARFSAGPRAPSLPRARHVAPIVASASPSSSAGDCGAAAQRATTTTAVATRPSCDEDVAGFAAASFAALARLPATSPVPLAKMALWVALEEEANDLLATEAAAAGRSSISASSSSSQPPSPRRTAASRATWSLERLDALAVEARAAFLAAMELEELGAGAAHQQHHHQQQRQRLSPSSSSSLSSRPRPPPLLPPLALPPALKRLVARVTLPQLPALPPVSFPLLLPRPTPPRPPWSPSLPPHSSSPSSATLSPALSDAATTEAMRRFPARALEAVSEVLFRHHGYGACGRYGVARDALLPDALESGKGTCSALTLLYSEVSRRAGFPVRVRPLNEASERAAARAAEAAAAAAAGGGAQSDDAVAPPSDASAEAASEAPSSSPSPSSPPLAAGVGATPPYAVLWPEYAASSSLASSSPPLRLPGGANFVVDAYGGGALLSASEVCELFGVEGGEAALFAAAAATGASASQPESAATAAAETTPSSAQQHAWGRLLIAATLAELRDAHWASACGRGPAPRDLPPLTAATALRSPPTRLDHAAAERAASAALKRLLVLSPLAAGLRREAAAAAEAAQGLGGGVAAARTAGALAASASAAAAAARAECELTAARLDLAVLRYFTGRYEDAWLELGAYCESVAAAGERDDDAEVLLEKLRLEITAR